MLSVMVPVNVCLPGAAATAATARRLKIRCLITSRSTSSPRCPLEIDLAEGARATVLLKRGRLATPPSGFAGGAGIEGSRPVLAVFDETRGPQAGNSDVRGRWTPPIRPVP